MNNQSQKSSIGKTVAVSLTNYLDAGAIVAGASGLSLWQRYLSLTESHLGWLNALSANCLGAAIGAIIGGVLADKYGRKMIYTYNMWIYMIGVCLICTAVSFFQLLSGFLVTGISVGVGVPASWTYISESSEVHNRGRNIAISQVAWGVGPTIILILGTLLAPTGLCAGWVASVAHAFGAAEGAASEVFASRLVFASLFVVAFIAWCLQRRLEESQEWIQRHESGAPQRSVFASFGSLFTHPVNVRTLLFLAGMYLTWNLVSSVMGFFQQHIYETAGGLTNEMANLLSVGQWIGIITLTFLFSLIVDKVNQRWLYFVGILGGILAWVMVITVGINSMKGLLLFTALWTWQAGISVQSFYALWASELFPARYRAAAQGVMFFLVRGLSAVWSFGFTYIYAHSGFTSAAYIMMGLLIFSCLIGTIGAPSTRGRSLLEIEKMRYGDHDDA